MPRSGSFILGIKWKSQGLKPVLYVLYTFDLPTSRETTLRIFADDTATFATHEDPTIASLKSSTALTHHRKMATEMENEG